MRTVITFAVLGLALGLAAQVLPRAFERDASVLPLSGAQLPRWVLDPARREGGTVKAVAAGEAAVAGKAVAPGEVAAAGEAAVAGKAVAAGEAAAAAEAAAAGEAAAADEAAPAWHEPIAEEQIDTHAPNSGGNEGTTMRPIERLKAAGFTADRAREIITRESRLRDEVIKAEYAATGTIRALGGSSRSVVTEKLREELGEDVYETYREAMGQPTRVRVGDVESGSAAANAGVLTGDEILSYAGRRVFDSRELNARMLQTSIGETVAMAIVRDGQKMQLYVTGGPLGISQRAVR